MTVYVHYGQSSITTLRNMTCPPVVGDVIIGFDKSHLKVVGRWWMWEPSGQFDAGLPIYAWTAHLMAEEVDGEVAA